MVSNYKILGGFGMKKIEMNIMMSHYGELLEMNEAGFDKESSIFDMKRLFTALNLENEILTFKFQMVAIKYKLNIKIKRTKEYYFFWFKFGNTASNLCY